MGRQHNTEQAVINVSMGRQHNTAQAVTEPDKSELPESLHTENTANDRLSPAHDLHIHGLLPITIDYL